MILIHARVPFDPDRLDEARDLAADLAEASRAEDGVIDYRVGADVEEPGVLRFVEQYESEAALGAHGESDHYQEFQAALPGMLVGEPELTQFEIESAAELDL